VRDALFKAMRKPPRELGVPPGRPQGIALTDSAMAEGLVDLLAEAGLELDIFETDLPEEFKTVVAELEGHLRGGPEHPGYLSVEGVTPDLVGAFYAAAAEFYRAAPWVHLNNYQVLALRHPEESDYRFVIVMGQGGVEYGLATYRTWEDVENLFASDDNPMEKIPESGLLSLFYDGTNMVPFPDLDALEKYHWPIAAPNAYPVAVLIDKEGKPERPSRQDLLWYEAALRVIPMLVRDYLKSDGSGDYMPLERTVSVSTHTGPVEVAVKYPAGQLPLAEQPPQDLVWLGEDDDEEEEEGAPRLDLRAMEGSMFQLTQELGGETGTGDAQLDKAQELMYQAWEETNPAKRIALAHDALVLSPNCADAYVLLAEEEADTVTRALEYYQQGVEAGARALGPKAFKRNTGHFWSVLETRPYMRAREGLANMLWRLNRKEDALGHYRELLHLNPNDNQGIRYVLVDLLLQMEHYDEVEPLLKKYREDWSAVWLYTRALFAFRKSGRGARANKVLAEAFEENPSVPAYLTGEKRVPNVMPEYMGMGDESEAMHYASDHLNYWRRVPGAVEWLAEQVKDLHPKTAPPGPMRSGKPKKKRKL
jgi:tetratricopeptide (TPR) repeat protein